MKRQAYLNVSLFWFLSLIFLFLIVGPIHHVTAGAARVIVEPTIGLLFVLLLNRLWLQTPLHFNSPLPFAQQLAINTAPAIYVGFILLTVSAIPSLPAGSHIIAAAMIALATAAFEELTFRGVILGALLRRLGQAQILPAVVFSSLCFALTYLTNLRVQPLLTTSIQLLLAFALSMLLAAIYLRTGSLWWPIACHFLNVFLILAFQGVSVPRNPNLISIVFSLLFGVLNLLAALWLLRPEKRSSIIRRFCA